MTAPTFDEADDNVAVVFDNADDDDDATVGRAGAGELEAVAEEGAEKALLLNGGSTAGVATSPALRRCSRSIDATPPLASSFACCSPEPSAPPRSGASPASDEGVDDAAPLDALPLLLLLALLAAMAAESSAEGAAAGGAEGDSTLSAMTLMTNDDDPSPPLPGRLPRERCADKADAAGFLGDFPGVLFRSFFPPLRSFLKTPPFFFVADFVAEKVTCC